MPKFPQSWNGVIRSWMKWIIRGTKHSLHLVNALHAIKLNCIEMWFSSSNGRYSVAECADTDKVYYHVSLKHLNYGKNITCVVLWRILRRFGGILPKTIQFSKSIGFKLSKRKSNVGSKPLYSKTFPWISVLVNREQSQFCHHSVVWSQTLNAPILGPIAIGYS